jgi:hypothetical protein
MNSSKFTMTLDLHKSQSQYSISARVGDTNRKLLINLTDGGVPYKIPEGCYAYVSIKRPNGVPFEDPCAIKDSTVIEYQFREGTAAMAGIHTCDLTLCSLEGEVLGSPKFTLVVNDRAVKDDTLDTSTEPWSIINAAVIEETKRQYNENQRVEAEDKRVAAEEVRKEQETIRQEAEAERNKTFGDAWGLINYNDKRITNLEKGYSDDLFITDNTNTAKKVVPYNALPYAEVKKVYGNIGYSNGTYFLKNPMRVESCKIFEKEIVDVTLDLSEMVDTMSVNKLADGSIAFTGTTFTGTTQWYRFATITIPKGKWKMSIRENGGAFAHDFIISDRPNGTSLNGRVEQAAEDRTMDLYVLIDESNEYTVFIEMLNENSAISMIEIPEEIRNIPYYGCTPDNYLDLENKQLVIKRRLIDNKVTFVDPPEVIDVSQYLGDDNLIEVVPNGYIRVIQETGEEMVSKSEVVFMVKGV